MSAPLYGDWESTVIELRRRWVETGRLPRNIGGVFRSDPIETDADREREKLRTERALRIADGRRKAADERAGELKAQARVDQFRGFPSLVGATKPSMRRRA